MMKQLNKLALPLFTSVLMLSACGSGSDKVDNAVNEGLDKLTPESGVGFYTGYFIENTHADGNPNDTDIGAMFVNVKSGIASNVSARMSFQQLPCQKNNLMQTDSSAVRTDRQMAGVLQGNLDPISTLDKDLLNKLDFKSPFTGSLTGSYTDSHWRGNYTLTSTNPMGVVASDSYHLSSGIDNCSVNYTVAKNGDFHLYPTDYTIGNLNISLTGVGSAQSLTWTTPANTAKVLVSQIDVNQAKNGGDGYVQNQLFSANMPNSYYTPINIGQNINYLFVVQTFDANNQLTGYQTFSKTL